MTSFGGKICNETGFMPTLKVQGQIYHLIGSLLPAPGLSSEFLQLYFMGDLPEEVRMRYNLNANLRSHIIAGLQSLLHERNPFIRDLRTVIERQDMHNLQVIIHADRKPAGKHSGRYKASTTNEVAIFLVDQHIADKRDIVLTTKSGALRRISKTHRSYDCLQYPLMFSSGEDGYSIKLPLINPVTKQPTTTTVSSLNFYAYRMMDGLNQINHLLYYRSLLNHFLVDMWAKIETERLNYLRFNQSKLRAKQYVHSKDAIERDGNLEDIGQLVILPSSFYGGPRYMHQRIQDTMTYVRNYGHPDLFITFTCNPKWTEIQHVLSAGQQPHDRYDIISRVFHLKVKN